MTKICSKCGIEKELSEFNKCKKGILGYAPCCKECAKVQVKEDMYYKRPAEELIWLTRAEHINIHREIN
jgi:hypothetical protein